MTVDEMIDDLIDRESGYGNDPADRGGATRWGISQAVARAQGYAGDMRGLPRDEAAAIYRRVYWLRPGFDRVSARAPDLAAALFDTAVNMGAGTAAGFLQRCLNALNRSARDYADIVADDVIGPATLTALDGFLRKRGPTGATVLLKAIEALKGERYVALAERRPADEAFLYGWLANRLG